MRNILLFLIFSITMPITMATVSFAADQKTTQTSKAILTEQLLFAARTSFKQKKYDQAVELYHHILSLNPALVQVRFSLAETYLVLKQFDQAEYHFKLVLAQEIPPQIADLVRGHLAYINRQKIWQVSFGVDITPESNINQGTTNKTIIIGGIPFTLNDDSLAKSGININGVGALVITPQLDDHIYGHFKVSATGNFLTGPRLFHYKLGGELGVKLKLNADSYGLGISYHRQFFDHVAYSSRYGIWANWSKVLSDRLYWSGRFSLDKKDYDTAAQPEYYTSLSQTLSYEHSAELGFHISPTLAFKKSYINNDDTATMALNFGTRHSLSHYFTINTNVSAQYETHFKENNLFAKVRNDLTLKASIRVANAKLRIFDFAPYIEYQYQNRNSNIQLFDFQNHAITFGLTKRF